MRPQTQKIARFGLLTALALVLGLMDRAIPVSALLGGMLPGIKLGLANTVLLYAVYLMDWKSCVALMLTKVVLSGFLFGSLSAILFSLSGGVLSLLVMLLLRKKPEAGAVATILLTAAAEIYLLGKNRNPQGEMLVTVILIGLAFIAGVVVLILTHQGIVTPVMGTSLAGAVTHNIGQVLMACLVMNNTRLLISYLPALIGIGAAVGCLTGVVTDRVLTALKLNSELRIHNS